MRCLRLFVVLLFTATSAAASALARVEVPAPRSPVSFIAAPAALSSSFLAPSVTLSVSAAPSAFISPSAAPAAFGPSTPAAPLPAAPALRSLPAASTVVSPPAAPTPAAPDPRPLDLITLTMPNGRTITVSRGVMNEDRRLELAGEGPDGILLDMGPSETAVGIGAQDIAKRPSDWALLSHDGTVTRVTVNRGQGRPGIIGGPARSVLILKAGSARALGVSRGKVIAQLGEGSSVTEVAEALKTGEFTPADLADSLARNPASEPRLFLDAILPLVDGERRTQVLTAIAKQADADGYLRMQAATELFLDTMPRALLRFDAKWRGRVVTALRYSDIWIHETGHQLVAKLVGAPLMEKRVYAHGAGFVGVAPGSSKPARIAIDLAGGAAETAVGSSFLAAAALLLSAHGLWLLAAALPAAGLIALGAHLIYGSVAHAANDLEHVFKLLGWPRARDFMLASLEAARRDAVAAGLSFAVPARVFYRAAWRVLTTKPSA